MHNIPKLETAQLFVKGRMDKHFVLGPHSVSC